MKIWRACSSLWMARIKIADWREFVISDHKNATRLRNLAKSHPWLYSIFLYSLPPKYHKSVYMGYFRTHRRICLLLIILVVNILKLFRMIQEWNHDKNVVKYSAKAWLLPFHSIRGGFLLSVFEYLATLVMATLTVLLHNAAFPLWCISQSMSTIPITNFTPNVFERRHLVACGIFILQRSWWTSRYYRDESIGTFKYSENFGLDKWNAKNTLFGGIFTLM